jgi:hypothetical protein
MAERSSGDYDAIGQYVNRYNVNECRSRFLEYANGAVRPFYILHQTVILIVGYFGVFTNLPSSFLYRLLLSCSSMNTA